MAGKTFHKSERLKSKISINLLFKSGKSKFRYPLRMYFQPSKAGADFDRFAFAVSKKKHKKAVSRNQVKRRMREAVRINKETPQDQASKSRMDVLFLYMAPEILSFGEIEKSIIFLLNYLSQSRSHDHGQ